MSDSVARNTEELISEARQSRGRLGQWVVVLAAILVTAVAVAAWRVSAKTHEEFEAPNLSSTKQSQEELVPSSSPYWGDKDAQVTVVEFADFDCDFCSRHATQTLPGLRSKYGSKIRYVFRYYPITDVHPTAFAAAAAAECAHHQGRFWEYHDQLFASRGSRSKEMYDRFAQAVGLDLKKFHDCLDNGAGGDAVSRDIAFAKSRGLAGTPTFVINGNTNIVGAKPLDVFVSAIEPLLE